MGYNANTQAGASVSNDTIVQQALNIAGEACNEINLVLKDIQGGTGQGAINVLGDSGVDGTWTASTSTYVDDTAASHTDGINTGEEVLRSYGIAGTADITTAAGAMVIDDLMQKISTKVQVAAQLLSTANNIAKTASRVLSQG